MIGSEQIRSAVEAQRAVCEQSVEERRLTHEEVMSRLPPEAATALGPNGGWWAGQSRATLTAIFEGSEFMNEAHVHGFANRLQRTIVTVDVRTSQLVLSKYAPGYAQRAAALGLALAIYGATVGSVRLFFCFLFFVCTRYPALR